MEPAENVFFFEDGRIRIRSFGQARAGSRHSFPLILPQNTIFT